MKKVNHKALHAVLAGIMLVLIGIGMIIADGSLRGYVCLSNGAILIGWHWRDIIPATSR